MFFLYCEKSTFTPNKTAGKMTVLCIQIIFLDTKRKDKTNPEGAGQGNIQAAPVSDKWFTLVNTVM